MERDGRHTVHRCLSLGFWCLLTCLHENLGWLFTSQHAQYNRGSLDVSRSIVLIQYQESSRSTACTAAAAPSQDGQFLELGIPRSDCPDKGSHSLHRDLQCLAMELPSPLDWDDLPD